MMVDKIKIETCSDSLFRLICSGGKKYNWAYSNKKNTKKSLFRKK